MKKTAAIFMLCAALLSGCSGANDKKTDSNKTVNADETKNQELVLVMPENTAASVKYRINTFQKYATQFEAENPGVHITIEKLSGQSYQRDLNARLKEGKQTDLIFAPFYPLMTEAGMYADLLSFCDMLPPLIEVGASQDLPAIAVILTGLSPPVRRFSLPLSKA
ncbi:extracellular solute-binding protein [Paenibacillus ginsengarvi]|uniref:Extracellular solute-binding protein n=1 Tax=Paenibacillus ginsengarvi TaxID=400777 RepID=A0A3B0CMB2_9BACL|nr:extracellular solute-binding protein [Paenibacillus ginsengarvi]RKN86312.1 extracellular solute-binding protein [Paenibacillus ginsengarvi]